jgi:iron complex transport system substrate-binding protein
LKKVLVLLLVCLVFTSCTKESEKISNEFSIKDDIGIEVKLSRPPEKVISMAPNVTEAIYAIGGESKLAGVTTFCTYPPEAQSKTKVGDFVSPDFEIITSLKPDLVIINVEHQSNPTYQALENLGIKVYVVNIDNYDGVMNMIKNLGVIFRREDRANKLVDSLNSVKEDMVKSNHLDMQGGLVVISTNPLMTASGKTFINDIVSIAGFRNIYDEVSEEYPIISYEDVIGKDPDYIILPSDTTDMQSVKANMDELQKSLSTTKAVKNNKILVVDADVMFRPGPRVLNGVSLLRSKM